MTHQQMQILKTNQPLTFYDLVNILTSRPIPKAMNPKIITTEKKKLKYVQSISVPDNICTTSKVCIIAPQ